ncbi:hypothetical protein H5410_026005 [Solanum commersonii]|uniref:DUF4283 domain-containing protein n=1 Tax=Solanum commersonii TaxID=4109 RepID=A0A9J5YVA7_SOLCO|nr:hypothetical protein H5410_026005 [Solanum commersonii]
MLNGKKRRKEKMIMNLKDSALGVEVSKASIRYYQDSQRELHTPPYGAARWGSISACYFSDDSPAATISGKENQGKPTYAATVTTVNQSANVPKHPRESVIARITTHNGIPAVIFKAKDYYGIMAEEYFTNEDDFNLVWFKRVIEMEGLQMWLQKWTLDFKPEEDIPIAPVWVLLPGFPFYMHSWHYVKKIVSSIGIPLAMDVATNGRTRPSMAKVRVEIDLLKSHPKNVWVGLEDEESPLRGYYQKLEYENIPKYCKHCRKLVHNVMHYRVLENIRINEAKEEEDKNNKFVNITQGEVDTNRGK